MESILYLDQSLQPCHCWSSWWTKLPSLLFTNTSQCPCAKGRPHKAHEKCASCTVWAPTLPVFIVRKWRLYAHLKSLPSQEWGSLAPSKPHLKITSIYKLCWVSLATLPSFLLLPWHHCAWQSNSVTERTANFFEGEKKVWVIIIFLHLYSITSVLKAFGYSAAGDKKLKCLCSQVH